MGPSTRLLQTRITPSSPSTGPLTNAHSRLSNTHTRLIDTLDALDALKLDHSRDMSRLTHQRRTQDALIRNYEDKLAKTEAERDDLKEAVQLLIEQVERCNDYRLWPHSRMKLSGDFADPMSELVRNPTSDDRRGEEALEYATRLARTLRSQLTAEKAAHDQTKALVAELEAKVARREAELERVVLRQARCPSCARNGEGAVHALDATVMRNRVLEMEIHDLAQKLEQARIRDQRPNSKVGMLRSLTKEVDALSTAIDGLERERTHKKPTRHSRPTPPRSPEPPSLPAPKPPEIEHRRTASGEGSSKRRRIAEPEDTPPPRQPEVLAPTPIRPGPSTSADWTGLRTPEPTITLLQSPAKIGPRPLPERTSPETSLLTASDDDDGEKSMELATPLQPSTIVSVRTIRRSRSRSNTPRRRTPNPSGGSRSRPSSRLSASTTRVSPGTPTPLSRHGSEQSISSFMNVPRSPVEVYPQNNSRPPSPLRLSPRSVPLPPSSSEDSGESSSRGRTMGASSSGRSERHRSVDTSRSSMYDPGDADNSFEREYARERRRAVEEEHVDESRVDTRGRLEQGERALGELKTVFDDLRRVLVASAQGRRV